MPSAQKPRLRHRLARILPVPLVGWLDRRVFGLRRARIRATHAVFARLGLNIVKHGDYYSTLPVLKEIEKTRGRWDRPSALVGLDIDVAAHAEAAERDGRGVGS